jgi:hypothetical protein
MVQVLGLGLVAPARFVPLSQSLGPVRRRRSAPGPYSSAGLQPERILGVTACNRKQPGLQSARFQDHISCLYPFPQDHISCH